MGGYVRRVIGVTEVNLFVVKTTSNSSERNGSSSVVSTNIINGYALEHTINDDRSYLCANTVASNCSSYTRRKIRTRSINSNTVKYTTVEYNCCCG